MKKLVMAFFVMMLCSPAYAHGNTLPGPSREESLQIAERWIANEGLHNPCVGHLTIRVEENPHVDGVPTRGHAGVWRNQIWDPTLCEVTIKANMAAEEECEVLSHEYMHVVRGPEHTGVLGTTTPWPAECRADRRTPRQVLHDTMREMLPSPHAWRIRCNGKHCIAIAPTARYSRVMKYRYSNTGELVWSFGMGRKPLRKEK